MLTKPQVKRADDCIKDEFLRLNTVPVGAMIQEFTRNINAAIQHNHPDYHIYLKGGNAISALSGANMTGDFDFQLVPDDAAYLDWRQTVTRCDTLVFTAFEAAINAAGQLRFNTDPFTIPPVVGQQVFPADSEMYRRDFKFGHAVLSERRNQVVRVGRQYANMDYYEIINDRNFDPVQQRLQFTPLDIQNRLSIESEALPDAIIDNGPMYYVNYTIPGFILYRLVYSHKYTDNDPALGAQENTYILKSEIIDVSVPRKGSGEVYLSQDHVITHFREYVSPGPPEQRPLPQGVTMSIPGWGYHLYEAITLLQEMELGISGSSHKKQKRLDRGRQALKELLRAGRPNMNVRYGTVLFEPCSPQESSQILNYIQALIYNVDSYGAATYDSAAIDNLRRNLETMLSEHLNSCCCATMASHLEALTWAKLERLGEREKNKRLDQELEYLYKFRIKTAFDQTAKKAKDVWDLYGVLKREYNNSVHLLNPRVILGDDSIVFISPFKATDEDILMPMNYAVAAVTTVVFEKLFRFAQSEKIIIPHVLGGPIPQAFTVRLRGKSLTFRIIFQSVAALPNPADTHLPEILKRTIIQSQRYALVMAVQNRRQP